MQPSTSTFQKPAARQNGSLIRQAGYADGGLVQVPTRQGMDRAGFLARNPNVQQGGSGTPAPVAASAPASTPIAAPASQSGQDPLAGQYGHAAVGAPVDKGAAMDRKVLASLQPAPTTTTQPPDPMNRQAGRAMLDSFQPMAMPALKNGGAIHGGSMMDQATRGYAGGGEVSALSLKGIGKSMGFFKTPEEKLAERQAAYAKKQAATQPTPAAPTAATAPTGGIGGYVANNALDKRMAAAGLKNGGMIKGPGTPTSDSIPAQVQETGEPIKVSTGERIVSASQNSLLEKIAKARGYKSVDQMFEAETGKPVGPTIKGGQKAAATGAELTKAYTDANQKVNDLQPSYWQTKTPTSERDLANAQAAANTALTALSSQKDMSQPGSVAPTTPTPGQSPAATSPIVNPSAGYQGKGYLDPRRTDIDTSNPALGASRDMTKELAAVPKDLSMLREGQIYKTAGKNGSTVYSGVNVGNDAQMVDGMGKKIDSRGTLSVMPSSPSQVGSSPAMSAALQAAMARGDTAAVQAYYNNQGQSFNGVAPPSATDKIMNTPMTKSQRAAAVELARINAGQPLQQAQIEASNASTQGSLLKISQDKQLAAAREAYEKAKTPDEKEVATRRLIALGGLHQGVPTFHPGSRIKNVDGTETLTEAMMFNPNTMTATPVGSGQKTAATPRAEYDKLPKGATYTGTDGQQYTKG